MCYNQQGLTKLVLKRLYAAVSIKCLVQRFSGYLWDPAFFYTKASFLKFVFVFPHLISCPSFPVIYKFGFGEFLAFFINKIKKNKIHAKKKSTLSEISDVSSTIIEKNVAFYVFIAQ